ncbi:uncharacterized protein LOC135843309 [Planococcus citri]|uniref:uncharacterized protein LOC135843309 n=1 Tax=Planococcus citri TaxID=170843 RepID=UPI0031F951BB
MDETISNVHDLIYPSPVTLKEISSIVVVAELWREEICAHIEGDRLQNLYFLYSSENKNNIRLKTVIPNLPSVIHDFLQDYVETFRVSIFRWLHYHQENVFACSEGGVRSILSRFYDFSWDWNGTIHYPRTAKRMMLCDQFTEDEKFKIACLYCFEDDIKQIWPFISAKMDLHCVDFHDFPQLFYWICFLRNELHKVPNPRNSTTAEEMLYECESKSINHSFVKYFWDRVPSDKQPQIVIERFKIWSELFCRFILQKLNQHQLEMFLTAKGADFIGFLLCFESASIRCAFGSWMYIQNVISSSHFISYVNESLRLEAVTGELFYASNKAYLFREIWKSAPQHLKRSALENVLSNNPSYLSENKLVHERKPVKFLIALLQDATVEERNNFWRENWRNLISECGADNDDFLQVVKLCLRTENEIATMARYENIADYCVELLELGLFKKLNDCLSVFCSDVRKINELKRRLLWSNYVGKNSVVKMMIFRNIDSLSEFVNDAFQDAADLGVEFKRQFASSPVTQDCLLKWIFQYDAVYAKKFVGSLFSDGQVVVPVKKLLFERFKESLINGNFSYKYSEYVQKNLIWLLGSAGEVIKFKQSI